MKKSLKFSAIICGILLCGGCAAYDVEECNNSLTTSNAPETNSVSNTSDCNSAKKIRSTTNRTGMMQAQAYTQEQTEGTEATELNNAFETISYDNIEVVYENANSEMDVPIYKNDTYYETQNGEVNSSGLAYSTEPYIANTISNMYESNEESQNRNEPYVAGLNLNEPSAENSSWSGSNWNEPSAEDSNWSGSNWSEPSAEDSNWSGTNWNEPSTENSDLNEYTWEEPNLQVSNEYEYVEENTTTYENYSVYQEKPISGIRSLPESIMNVVSYQESMYPGINIGVGIFSLDGTSGYTYNANLPMSAACTVKAAYALFVLQTCENENIDIWSETLEYKQGMYNDGSGIIKYEEYGTNFTIAYLLDMLLEISDNTAYNILCQRFDLYSYQIFLNYIGGQQLYGLQYGQATVNQRCNEWVAIYNYINSNSMYSETLRQYLTGTLYCYLVEGMSRWHPYMHKSGWCYGSDYTSASDCAIIDNNYILIVISQDYSTGEAHTDVVNSIGYAVENYADCMGGYIF